MHVVELDRTPDPAGLDGVLRVGVETSVCMSSLIFVIDASADCHWSNTCESCWIGAKNWSRNRTNVSTVAASQSHHMTRWRKRGATGKTRKQRKRTKATWTGRSTCVGTIA